MVFSYSDLTKFFVVTEKENSFYATQIFVKVNCIGEKIRKEHIPKTASILA